MIKVISQSEKKNIEMCVEHSEEKGVKKSRTFYRVIDSKKPAYKSAFWDTLTKRREKAAKSVKLLDGVNKQLVREISKATGAMIVAAAVSLMRVDDLTADIPAPTL